MVASKTKSTRKKTTVDPLSGKKLLGWKAPDFQPYQRGLRWYITFCALTFGSAALVFWMDPSTAAVPVFSICTVSAIYLWVHKNGEDELAITLFEKGLRVGDSRLMPWEDFKGYWVLEDEVSRLLVLESGTWQRYRVRLQLGKTKTDRVVKAMEKVKDLEHLEEQKERAFDLWSRVFRL